MKKILLLVLLIAQPAWAAWELDGANSKLSFMSIKAGNVAEVHTFKNLSGSVDDAGKAMLTIQLVSVDTKIPLRDQRMRDMLFQTDKHPEAMLTAIIDMAAVDALKVGESKVQAIEAKLALHGQEGAVSGNIQISRLNDTTLQVSNFELFVVNAASFDLVAGVEKLREVAGLPAISTAVPISFTLTFNQQ